MISVLYMSDLHLEMERWRLGVPGWADFMARHRGLARHPARGAILARHPARGAILARHPARGPILTGLGKVDLVVLAGDVHSGLRSVVYGEQVADYLDAPVVLVAGNHEYYHHDMAVLLPAFRAAVKKTSGRVHFLENDGVRLELGGERVTVLGCTLWTDYALHGDAEAAMQYARLRMNDHNFIKLHDAAFTPWDARRLHEDSILWLRAELGAARREALGKTIIVTHHAPSGLLLGTRQGEIAPAYGSEIIGDFTEVRPDLWIHGHTHYQHDSVIAGIRVVSAPRGYVGYDGDAALQFRPGIVAL